MRQVTFLDGTYSTHKVSVAQTRKHAAEPPSNLCRGENSLPGFWQSRFYDFNVWSLKKGSRETALYAHESAEKKNW